MEKEERLKRAGIQKKETMDKIQVKRIQTKITEKMKEFPGNLRIITERGADKERRLLLAEAKEEIWKRLRQNKGRKNTNPRICGKKDNLQNFEEKLERIEKEVERYKDEERRKAEEEETKQREKSIRLEKKQKMEKHWETLNWIIQVFRVFGLRLLF